MQPVCGPWTLKTCRVCGETKAASRFSKHLGAKDGRRSTCNLCRATQEHDRYHSPEYKKKQLANAKHRKASRMVNCRAHYLITAAKRRAKERAIAFDLDTYKADIQARINRGVCEMTGISFEFSPKAWNGPSLDRIIPALGYIHSNVRVVIFALNVMMHTWGEDRMLEVARALLMRRAA